MRLLFPALPHSADDSPVRAAAKPGAPWHLWLPALVFLACNLLLRGLHGDQWLASRLYAWEGHAWALRSAHWARVVMHDEARRIVIGAWVALLILWCLSTRWSALARERRALGYLLLATTVSALAIAWMKAWTHVDCPWDLAAYGGRRAFHGFFSGLVRSTSGRCFPAGHAGSGYAWVAMYFVLEARPSRLRWCALAAALALGAALGAVQQLRGAHFMSHDLWSLTICWYVALGLSRLMLRREPAMPLRGPVGVPPLLVGVSEGVDRGRQAAHTLRLPRTP